MLGQWVDFRSDPFVVQNGVFWCICSFYSCRASIGLVLLEILSSCEVRINMAAKLLVRLGIYGLSISSPPSSNHTCGTRVVMPASYQAGYQNKSVYV